jgi:tetratricopeptide (TPR) repeat protein
MKRIYFSSLFVLAMLFTAQGIFAQHTRLNYRIKGKTTYFVFATLCNAEGDTSVNAEAFIQSPSLSFLVFMDPKAKKNAIRESDISNYLASISIVQGATSIPQSGAPVKKMRNEKEIGAVVITFSKEKLLLYNPFVLSSAIDKSTPIRLPDQLLPSFKKYKEVFDSGKQLFENKSFIKAYNVLFPIWKDAQSNEEIKVYGFYSDALKLLKQSAHKRADIFEVLYKQLDAAATAKIDRKWLNRCDSSLRALDVDRATFEPLFKSTIPDAGGLAIYFNNVKKQLNDLYTAKMEKYNQQYIDFLATGSYNNYQFALYIDVLSRMLTYTDTLVELSQPVSLSIEQLHHFPKKEQELASTGWLNDFKELVAVLNQNLKKKQVLVDENILNNLRNQDSLQKQPYLQIVQAFASLPSNISAFSVNLNEAMKTCTDVEWLNNLELWNISLQFSQLNLDSRYMHEINQGLQLIKNGKWAEADNTFNIIKRQANQLAMPWYYSGLIQYKQNEWFSAEAQFETALELNPKYISPRNFIFKILEDQKLYADLLKKVDQSIAIYDIWYFHYVKVQALYGLQRYQEAITELNTQCIARNRWDVNQYYLLGDIYVAMKDYQKAKEAYATTRKIDRFSDSRIYDDKMKNLVQLQTGSK